MGFMDKAKKMAEQAQEKLGDVQKQFNERQRHDGDTAPEAQAQSAAPTPPHGDPLADAAASGDAAPPPAPKAPPSPGSGLSGGDPLAG